jgi:hypothetical protein
MSDERKLARDFSGWQNEANWCLRNCRAGKEEVGSSKVAIPAREQRPGQTPKACRARRGKKISGSCQRIFLSVIHTPLLHIKPYFAGQSGFECQLNDSGELFFAPFLILILDFTTL